MLYNKIDNSAKFIEVIDVVTFGDRLKELRTENNLTLDQLKDSLNTTKATLSRYENNLREAKIDFAKKTAAFFNVSLDYMLGFSDNKNISSENTLKQTNVDDPNKALAIKLINELSKDGYVITEEDLPNLILAAKIALSQNKNATH